MIASASAPFLLVSLSQDAAQSAAHVGVDAPKDICFAVLEVPKPSSHGPAQILADGSHASTFRTPGLLANRLLEYYPCFSCVSFPVQNDSPESRTLRLDWHSPAVFCSGAVAGRFLPPSALLVLRPLELLAGCDTR